MKISDTKKLAAITAAFFITIKKIFKPINKENTDTQKVTAGK